MERPVSCKDPWGGVAWAGQWGGVHGTEAGETLNLKRLQEASKRILFQAVLNMTKTKTLDNWDVELK